LEFVGFAIYHEAVRIAPVFNHQQDSVRLGVNKRSRDARGERTLRDRSEA
jgi:hypothetical protein